MEPCGSTLLILDTIHPTVSVLHLVCVCAGFFCRKWRFSQLSPAKVKIGGEFNELPLFDRIWWNNIERRSVSYIGEVGNALGRTTFSQTLMSGHPLSRFFRDYGRALVVWAMMPLAGVNGRTMVGCGCTGHFEEICHCQSTTASKTCCQPRGSCCSGHGAKACTRCSAEKSDAASDSRRDRAADAIRHIGTRHCVRLAVHEVIPVTVVPIISGDVCQIATLDCSSADRTFLTALSASELVVQLDLKCPPNDLVVMLHRFII